MPANSRPKQRTLIRWNDDLDKSLLLFIHHTCNDVGIKIPYDEIGRRMGANFSEGAIVQHIAKLRGKMADLNVAPVPDPTKRGQTASRPSSVYGAKGRNIPPPAPPSISNTSKGRGRRSETARPTGVTKARASRKKNGRRIKRSESDIEEEEEDEMEDQDQDPSSSPTGGQRRGSRGQAASRVAGNSQPGRSHVSRSINGLLQTNPYDPGPPVFNLPNYGLTQEQQAFPYASIEQNQAIFDGFPHYALAEGNVDDDEIEEEEESLPIMARKAAGQNQFQLQSHSPGNISPKSGGQMALAFHTPDTAQAASPFHYGNVSQQQQQQMQQSRIYSSNPHSNYDYSDYGTSSGAHTTFMTPASVFPTPVPTNMPGSSSSQSSSRNDSAASQASLYGNAAVSHTPMHERSHSTSMNQMMSPPSRQGPPTTTHDSLLSSALATMSNVQPSNMGWGLNSFHGDSQFMSDFSQGQVDFLSGSDYDMKACDTFFQNTFAADMDQMDFSGSSQ